MRRRFLGDSFTDFTRQWSGESKAAPTGEFAKTIRVIDGVAEAVSRVPNQAVYSRGQVRAIYDGLVEIDDAARRAVTQVKQVEYSKSGYVWRWDASELDRIKKKTEQLTREINSAWDTSMLGYGAALARRSVEINGEVWPSIQTPFVLFKDDKFFDHVQGYLGVASSVLADASAYEQQYLALFRLGWFGNFLLAMRGAAKAVLDGVVWVLKQVPAVPGYVRKLTTYATYAGAAYVAYKIWEENR